MHPYQERRRGETEIDAVVMPEERGNADDQTDHGEPRDGRAPSVTEHCADAEDVEENLRVVVQRGSQCDRKDRRDEGRYDGRRHPRRHQKEPGCTN